MTIHYSIGQQKFCGRDRKSADAKRSVEYNTNNRDGTNRRTEKVSAEDGGGNSL